GGKRGLDALLQEAVQADPALASHVDLDKLATIFDPVAAAQPARRLAERQLDGLRADMAAFGHHHPFHE
ncbi:MAG TPA: 3-carboxy-cis,cis-muconate cycloisomerase, partial [Massilia sp.]|nr:3-carboxy-cis,cis-muconate cycloisomerase [Massilia sp.]